MRNFEGMDDLSKQIFCQQLVQFSSFVGSIQRTVDVRNKNGVDANTKWIARMVEDMTSSLADMKHNPCLKWEFENEF